jgi:hypothetical protein
VCVAPAVGVSWYWPPGRTYKSPEKALGFSHESRLACGSICSQSPLIELETESLEAVSVTKGKERAAGESACGEKAKKGDNRI